MKLTLRPKMFFATPQLGMDSAAWPDFVKHVLRSNAPRPWVFPTKKMLNDMESNISSLVKVSEDFKPLQKKLSFVTFLEDHPMDGLNRVVGSPIQIKCFDWEDEADLLVACQQDSRIDT